MFLIININKPTYECAKHVIGKKIHEKYKFLKCEMDFQK